MRGPELWGAVVFALNNIKERITKKTCEAQPCEDHILRITGDLSLVVTRLQNSLPKSPWDRQRDAGHLADGETRVLWTIHDNHIPDRPCDRWFDVIFARKAYADTPAMETRSFNAWREFVRREWLAYLLSGWLGLISLLGSGLPATWMVFTTFGGPLLWGLDMVFYFCAEMRLTTDSVLPLRAPQSR